MNDKRYFTVEEANRLLPTIIPILRELRELWNAIQAKKEVAEELGNAARGNGGGEDGAQYLGEYYLGLQRYGERLAQLGVLLKDIQQGLIDFPFLREGREVYLCWRLGEEAIGYWHEVESGFAGRQPLDTLSE